MADYSLCFWVWPTERKGGLGEDVRGFDVTISDPLAVVGVAAVGEGLASVGRGVGNSELQDMLEAFVDKAEEDPWTPAHDGDFGWVESKIDG